MTTLANTDGPNRDLHGILESAAQEMERGEGIDHQEIRRRIRDWRDAAQDHP